MKQLFLIIAFVFAGITSQAQEQQTKKKSVEVVIPVNGNCDMCKKRIEKAAYSVRGVKKAEWHVDCQDIHVTIDQRKTSAEEVSKAIAKVGHDTEKYKADLDVYDALPGCCKYRD